MTAFVAGQTPRLSRSTVESLADLGYEVDSAAADEFEIPRVSLRLLLDPAPEGVDLADGREGLSTRAFTMRLMHMGMDAHWIWDDTTPCVGPGALLIATSGPAMGNLFEQALLITFDMIAIMLRDRFGITPQQMEHRHRNLE